jgi:hypothetical protein
MKMSDHGPLQNDQVLAKVWLKNGEERGIPVHTARRRALGI